MLPHFRDLNDRTLPDHLHDEVHEDYDISECTMVKSYRFVRYLQHFNKLQAECKRQTAHQVEPLSYVNDSDKECISTLPPSHFLTCDVLSVPAELPSTSNYRDRWELLQNIKRGFWKKWSSEFISSLQLRKKWQDAQPNLKEDDIVLIKEEGPPGAWPMARVLQVHPGNDGLVRVVTVKTQVSVLKRPIHKLHKLPIYPN
ncbi:DUF1759 domain-containing protein [Trichonephila clavipes]|nr:DUF1759 domain-containing protein [Trichonephila clavipes]